MSEPHASYPSAQAGEETVRDLLRASLNKRVHALADVKSANRVLPIQSQKLAFDDFLIRTTALSSGLHKRELLELLNAPDSALHISATSPLYVASKVSQSLMQLDGEKLPKIDRTQLQLDFVPKHAGKPMDEWLYFNTGRNCRRLAQHFLDHPEALSTLCEEAAFAGSHDQVNPNPDFVWRNMMVEERKDGSLHVSLIDLVPPERFGQEEKYHNSAQQSQQYEHLAGLTDEQTIATQYVARNDKSIRDALHSVARKLPSGSELRSDFQTLLDNTIEATKQKIKEGTLEENHPEWKGFTQVDDVAAIPLNAPSYVLKEQLQRLYARAVPEQGAQR